MFSSGASRVRRPSQRECSASASYHTRLKARAAATRTNPGRGAVKNLRRLLCRTAAPSRGDFFLAVRVSMRVRREPTGNYSTSQGPESGAAIGSPIYFQLRSAPGGQKSGGFRSRTGGAGTHIFREFRETFFLRVSVAPVRCWFAVLSVIVVASSCCVLVLRRRVSCAPEIRREIQGEGGVASCQH